ncbi:hypothetical protein [Desulfovibrio sp. ZJ200]|uniref:hypothetical protein n=1 Tax=Desulfovibrio sp. ZJ200 TaxID=2709792 RepID=UPI0013EA949F|nr:hypothetical protein [Desulfovibrio sp. ZJ200]
MSDISRAAFLHVDIEYISNNIDKCQIIEKNKKLIQSEVNRNELLKKNKLCFCDGFTTCIFRNNIIKDNNIIFTEGLNNFEDIVFLVQCAYYANKISIIDSVYYYYCCLTKNSNSRRTNTYETLKMVTDSSKIVMDFLNTYDYDKYSYMYISRYIINTIKLLQVKTKLDIFLIEKTLLILKMNKFLHEDRDIQLLFTHFLLKKKLIKIIKFHNMEYV